MDEPWRERAAEQAGLLALSQLSALGVTRGAYRHRLAAGRWSLLTHNVVSTTTGDLTDDQRLWQAVLHAGPTAIVGGLTAAALQGLTGWERDDLSVLVDDELSFAPIEGVQFHRCRRDLASFRSPKALPVARLEPAVLLFAAYWPGHRTAHGALAACVQQRLTTPDRLRDWLGRLTPLRGARGFRRVLDDLDGGAQSISEIDVRHACEDFGLVPPARQRTHQERGGRRRQVDCEWDLPDGKVVVLEVEGGVHVEVRTFNRDRRRQRRLTTHDRIVVGCGADEIRYEPAEVMTDLLALGVPRVA